MMFEENWTRGFRREVIQRYGRTIDDDGRQVITIAYPELANNSIGYKSSKRTLESTLYYNLNLKLICPDCLLGIEISIYGINEMCLSVSMLTYIRTCTCAHTCIRS